LARGEGSDQQCATYRGRFQKTLGGVHGADDTDEPGTRRCVHRESFCLRHAGPELRSSMIPHLPLPVCLTLLELLHLEIEGCRVFIAKSSSIRDRRGRRLEPFIWLPAYSTVNFVAAVTTPPLVVIFGLLVMAPAGTTAVTCVSEFTVKVVLTLPNDTADV